MCSTYRAAPQGEIDARGLNVSTQKRKCSGGDLNPHALRHTPLKRTCLPFHHPSERRKFNEERRKARPDLFLAPDSRSSSCSSSSSIHFLTIRRRSSKRGVKTAFRVPR